MHCASAVTSASADVVSETMPTQCTSNGGHTVNWCAVSVATNRYALYRTVDTTCNSSGAQQVDYLMSNSVFTATPATTTKLANLAVDFKVDLKSPSTCAPSNDCYELADNIYLRNSVRG